MIATAKMMVLQNIFFITRKLYSFHCVTILGLFFVLLWVFWHLLKQMFYTLIRLTLLGVDGHKIPEYLGESVTHLMFFVCLFSSLLFAGGSRISFLSPGMQFDYFVLMGDAVGKIMKFCRY